MTFEPFCDRCDGYGAIDCRYCFGDGCDECEWKGERLCPDCRGEMDLEDESEEAWGEQWP